MIMMQRELLKVAVVGGEVNEVRNILEQASNIGLRKDLHTDRVYALELLKPAIQNDDHEVLRILFNKGAFIGKTLFTAVQSGALKCAKVMVELSKKKRKEEPYNSPSTIEETDLKSPLMLAIQLNRHDIVGYFVSEGYCIEDVDDGKTEEKVLHNFHSFSARADPIYISYRFIHDKNEFHPLSELYTLHKQLLKISRIDDEYREDYIKMADQCEDFAVDLINKCRNLKEKQILTGSQILKDLLAMDSENSNQNTELPCPERLVFLYLAIKRKWDKVVAHPYSQLQLNMAIHPSKEEDIYKSSEKELPTAGSNSEWRYRNNWSIAGYALRHFIAMPFLATVCIFDAKRSNRVSVYMKNPMIKFMSHYSSMLVFVSLLIASSFQEEFSNELLKPSIPEWLILAWVVGSFVQVFEEMWNQKRDRYFAQWWNTTTLLMLISFTISYILRVVAYGISGSWAVLDPITDFSSTAAYKVILLANSFFSLAMLFSFICLSAIFQVHHVLGPLQISLGHLLDDVMKFTVFFTYIVLAFGLSLRKLYSHYISMQQQIAKARSASTNGTDYEVHHLTDVSSGFSRLFWALFGLTDLEMLSTKDNNFTITKETGEVLFGLFQVIAVIVTINMLIAMMTRSFEEIASDAVVKWKLSRTRLWMCWIERSTILPAPLNVIETCIHLIWKCYYCRKFAWKVCFLSAMERLPEDQPRMKIPQLTVNKCFPKNHPLNKTFNKHTLKISYSCMPNVKSIISSHNKKVLSTRNTEQEQKDKRECNCRKKTECPLEGKCLQNNVIYQATITTDTTKETYIGLATNFKERYRNHKCSLKLSKRRNETELSKYIWKLKEEKKHIKWKIIKKWQPYNNITKNVIYA